MDSIIISQKKLAAEVFYSFSASRETKQGYYIEPESVSESFFKHGKGSFHWKVVDKSGSVPFPVLATYTIDKSDIRLDSLNAGDLREFFKDRWVDFQRTYFDGNGNLSFPVGNPKKSVAGHVGGEKSPAYCNAVQHILQIAKAHGISLSAIDVMCNGN